MQNQPRIDETDAKILRALLRESRTSFTKIAKDCKISVPAVSTRYRHMLQAGIINGQIIQINPQSLGYKCVGDIGITTVTDREKQVTEFLKTKSLFTIETWGKYDVDCFFAQPSIQNLTSIIEELEGNRDIKQTDALIWAKPAYIDHPENLIIKPLSNENDQEPTENAEAKPEETQIDQMDRLIAKILTTQSRKPFAEIARTLNTSTKTVIQRYQRLRKEKVLTLSSITIDLGKLGYTAMAHFFIKAANKGEMPQIYSNILKIPNLIVAIRTFGAYDLHAMAPLEDFNQHFDLLRRLRRIRDIEKTETYIIPPFHKWPANVFQPLL